MSDPVVFVDCETLGLDPDVNPIWEIGLILPDGKEREWQVEVTPRDISLAHPVALEISGFDRRYGHDRAIDTRADVCRDLDAIIPTGAHLCGAVVSFDEERLRRMLWAEGYSPRWHYHLVDVETLAKGFLYGRSSMDGPEDRIDEDLDDSEVLSRAVGVDPADFDRHTALGDARWAKAIYEAVVGK